MPETEFILNVEDCVTGMKRLPEKSVDLVVTSPPYNLGIKYSKYKDELDSDAYLRWTLEWAGEVKRVLKDNGSFFLNLGGASSNPLFPHEVVLALGEVFVLQNTFHWIKSITIETRAGDEISAGHFKPLNSKRLVNDCHEYVFHLTKIGGVILDRLGVGVSYQDKSNIARWGHTGGRDRRCRGNNWFIPYKTIKFRAKDRPHPATFPVQLAVNCIRIHGCASDLVMLDPFVGIGHAALAAQECKIKRFYGFDIDEQYVQVARALLTNGRGVTTPPADQTVAPKSGKRGRPRKKAALDEASLFPPDMLA